MFFSPLLPTSYFYQCFFTHPLHAATVVSLLAGLWSVPVPVVSDHRPACLTDAVTPRWVGAWSVRQRALFAHIWAELAHAASRAQLLSSAHWALWKGEATDWGWEVFSALINVTVRDTSSLMWNRHVESVEQAYMLMEKQHPVQIMGPHLSPWSLSRGPAYRILI